MFYSFSCPFTACAESYSKWDMNMPPSQTEGLPILISGRFNWVKELVRIFSSSRLVSLIHCLKTALTHSYLSVRVGIMKILGALFLCLLPWARRKLSIRSYFCTIFLYNILAQYIKHINKIGHNPIGAVPPNQELHLSHSRDLVASSWEICFKPLAKGSFIMFCKGLLPWSFCC